MAIRLRSGLEVVVVKSSQKSINGKKPFLLRDANGQTYRLRKDEFEYDSITDLLEIVRPVKVEETKNV